MAPGPSIHFKRVVIAVPPGGAILKCNRLVSVPIASSALALRAKFSEFGVKVFSGSRGLRLGVAGQLLLGSGLGLL